MPACHAAVHELGEADDPAAAPQAARQVVFQVNFSHRDQRAVAHEGPEKRPEKGQPVGQGRQAFSLSRLAADFGAALEELRKLLNLEIPLQKRLRSVEPLDEIPVAFAKLLAAHLLGNEVAVGIVLDQPALPLEPFVERRLGNCLEHADHRQRDAVFLDEAELVLEDLSVVAVEADDEPGVHVESRVLDPRQLGVQRVAARVLKLLGFLERFQTRRLDADEHAAEVRPVHQLHDFRLVGQVDAGLGRQPQRVAVPLHPGDDLFQQGLGLLAIADEVVVDDERRVEPGPPHVVEFGQELLRRLGPRLAPVNHDDVAELALKRAAARILERPGGVAIGLEQVVSRAGGLGHVGRLRLLVAFPGGPAAGEVLKKLRPGRLGLADEHHIAETLEKLLLNRNQRPTNNREYTDLAEPEKNLENPLLLHVHPGQADQVVAAERIPVDLFHVLVDQVHAVIAAKPCQRGQRAGDHRAPLVARIEGKGILETPIGGLKAGVDQTDRKSARRLARGHVGTQRRFDHRHGENPVLGSPTRQKNRSGTPGSESVQHT